MALGRPYAVDAQSGIHTDLKGNVYAGCGDGVHVWNTSGKLIGKIFVDEGVANFQVGRVSLACVDLPKKQFAGAGRMVICAETKLYYAEFAAAGAAITDYDYSQIL